MRYEAENLKFKFLGPLSFLYLTIFLASTATAYKLVEVGLFLQPAPPYIFPLTYVIIDIIAEVYGRKIANTIVFYTLVFQFVFALLITAVLALPVTQAHVENQRAYSLVFDNIIRFVLSGTIAVWLSSYINVYMLTKWKVLMKGRYFWFRSIMSSAIGGIVLVLIITMLAYTGVTVNTPVSIAHMFFSIYGLELLYACLLAVPAWYATAFIKYYEKTDVYEKI